jgi:hypothetical protein
MALVLSGSIDISGSMTATTILISSPGAAGMVSSSAQITELAPLMAYTASLKSVAIVSSSQQITNYFTFAQTASANTFYGNQSISGTLTATTSTTGAAIKLGGFTNYGTIQDVNDVRRIWFENVGSYRTIFDLPASGTSFAFRTNDGTSLFNVNSGSGASVGTGDLTITNGNLVMASGKGIDFSATANSSGTMTSELLNDYEEGTWTPVLTSDTSPSGVAYSDRYGKYTKIGRVVHIEFVIALSSKGTGTGDTFISGLPFTVANNMGSGEPACVNISLCQGLSTSVYVVAGFADNGSTNIQLRKTTAASTTYPQSYLNTTDISDSLYIQGSVTYHV